MVLSLGFVLLAAAPVGLLVQRAIYQPLGDLQDGAARLAAGDLEQPIPVRSRDELGQLAESFNSMMRALRNSRVELEEWGHTLEQKVEEATRELHLAQAEAARGEKLASVGLLAAGIAHELNNPLTGVLTFSTLVRKQMPEGSPEAEDLDLVIQETRRCAAIIRRLLDFAREKAPEKNYADLNQLIEKTVQLIGQSAQAADIEINMDLEASLPTVWIDENLIGQVIMNMLVNAQHAIEGSGRITIRTRLRCKDHRARGTECGTRLDGRDHDQRHRLRHPGGRSAEDFRPVFHDQGRRQGHRAGIVGQSRYHRGPRRSRSKWKARSGKAPNSGFTFPWKVAPAVHEEQRNERSDTAR